MHRMKKYLRMAAVIAAPLLLVASVGIPVAGATSGENDFNQRRTRKACQGQGSNEARVLHLW